MGFFEEPRYVLNNVVEKFVDMPSQTIREQTFCCGGGAGLNNEEFLEMRLRGGLPRGNAVKYVQEKHGVNTLSCICAIDRATLPALCNYWAPGVQVTGLHELVGNALVLEGEQERTMNLRQEPLPGFEEEE
jgi:Fe-S oxidoreductase